MSRLVLDLFAGPGGWDEGLLSVGVRDVVGIEMDASACATRAAAGHRTIRANVATYPVEPFAGRVRGLILSPPCPTFSMAGKGSGRREIGKLHAAVEACRGGWVAPECGWEDARTPLILEVLRWAWATRPDWIACEQVPPALGIWQHMADVLRSWGYLADARILCAADYGVPQTRHRAILIASVNGLAWPEPTHAEKPEVSLFGASRLPWVTMAQALGWDDGLVVNAGTPYQETPDFSADRPSRTIIKKTRDWALRQNNTENASVRPISEPAPTPHFGKRCNAVEWVHERPATTIVGSFAPDVVAAPGYRGVGDESRQNAEGSVRITVSEAAILQSFRPDYPFQGSKSKQFEQVGNAVPPANGSGNREAARHPNECKRRGSVIPDLFSQVVA